MKIALLGFGKEGQATKQYFTKKFNADFDIFENLSPEEFAEKDYSSYDMIFRSPSIPPLGLPNETSITKYFFDHCPCPIIGVTATKGKGTTCSFIHSLLQALNQDSHLVGNIGIPALDVLDDLTANSVVVYELSSFQLWDLEKSPHIAVLGWLEPDHLNVHRSYSKYLKAKANITTHQSSDDFLIYNSKNPEAQKIAKGSSAQKLSYPFDIPEPILASIKLPGQHNRDNAIAAVAAVASYLNISPDEFIAQSSAQIKTGLANFSGLPHRLEFVREINGVKYYDDNFSTNPTSTKVAIDAFPKDNLVLIVGGRDKTHNEDFPELLQTLSAPQVKKVILIGESGHALADTRPDHRFRVASTLSAAVAAATCEAEYIAPATVIMSPAAASFDMFKNAYERGEEFQKLVKKIS